MNQSPSLSLHPVRRIVAAVLLAALIAAAIIIPLTRHQRHSSTQTGQLQVVAAENFWGDIASQIGGSHVRVTSIITDPEADPHLYESSAANAQAVADADVVITNGVGYDDFMGKLLSSTDNQRRQVLTAADILKVDGKEVNPHLWYDVPRVHEVAAQIAQAFERKDPPHKSEYQANVKKFDGSLQPIINQIKGIKEKYSGQPVAYTERVAGYLLGDAGLTVKTPEGYTSALEEGTDPTPADSLAMNNLLTNRSIDALLYNRQATSTITEKLQTLAKQNNIPVVAVTETLPANTTYQAWQKSQVDALRQALESKQGAE